jgi:hypothetical protein
MRLLYVSIELGHCDKRNIFGQTLRNAFMQVVRICRLYKLIGATRHLRFQLLTGGSSRLD